MEQVELGTRDSGQLKSVDTMDNKSAQPRPDAPRRTTHPAAVLKKPPVPAAVTSDSPSYPRPNINSPTTSSSSSSSPASYTSNSLPLRPRNQVPYTRPHLRSRSHASALAPPMAPRAHSLPSVHSAGHQYPSSPSASPLLRPSSPMSSLSPRQPYSPKMRPSSPFRPRSPLPLDESTYAQQSSAYDGAFQSISEDAELSITPRSHLDNSSHTTPFGRSQSLRRQRPSSPLHSLTPSAATSRSASATSSPSVTTRFNENFPSLHHYSSNSSFSSISTTPSSARSRSPSISSLETIEDNPDLEWEAIEADRAAKQRAAEEAEEQGDDNEPRRSGSLDIPGHRSVGFGFGRRGGDANRKRWSICGGERTVDLDLETIWED